jgi:hypothetical protein
MTKRCSINEYIGDDDNDDETIVEFYDRSTGERVRYSFPTWDEAFEALPEIGL